MERCTIVVHCLQLSSFIRKDFYAKLTGTNVAASQGGRNIPKKVTIMSGGSIPASKVNLRTIRRVNPTMTGFRPALSVMLVVMDIFIMFTTGVTPDFRNYLLTSSPR